MVEAGLYLKSIMKTAKRRSHNFHEVITDRTPNIVGQEMFDSINEFNLDNKFVLKESMDKLV